MKKIEPEKQAFSNKRTSNDVCALLQESADICYYLGMLSQHEKNVFHVKGLQGFKRCFRYAARQYFERGMMLETVIIDHYMGVPESNAEYDSFGYEGDCITHMTFVCGELKEAEKSLSEIKTQLVLGNEHFAAGFIDKCLKSIQKEIKYMFRHLNYMMDVKGDISQLHWYSENLHLCMKDLEENKHNRYY